MLEKILNPTISTLCIFGLLICPIIPAGLYMLSFSWIFTYEFFVKGVYAFLFLVGLILFVLDRKYKWSLKKYLIPAVILLTLFFLLSYPVKDWMLENSELQGAKIGLQVEKYKDLHNHYPDDLESDFFSNLPRRSYIGSRFYYNKYILRDSTETYRISYYSFRGYMGHYNVEGATWYYTD